MGIEENLKKVKDGIPPGIRLVAISKTKSKEAVLEAYNAGHRDFGENKIQEMAAKHQELPGDIRWHMVGHVQRNKVKYMASFVDLVHAVDSIKLLAEIDKQAEKNNRTINCLLQIKIAEEESKYGINIDEAEDILRSDPFLKMNHVKVIGLMGMATLTDDEIKIRKEFDFLKTAFDRMKKEHEQFSVLSMGMSGDYQVALESGSNMVRIGSAIFGKRK